MRSRLTAVALAVLSIGVLPSCDTESLIDLSLEQALGGVPRLNFRCFGRPEPVESFIRDDDGCLRLPTLTILSDFFITATLLDAFRSGGEVGAVDGRPGGFDASTVTPTPQANATLVCQDQAVGIQDQCPPSQQADPDPNRSGGGMVLAFNGQEMLDETDLWIKGRDPVVDIRIQRRHLSGIEQPDPHFGPAWSINYVQFFGALNPALEPTGVTDAIAMRSFGRVDLFRKVAPNVWEGSDGRFGRLTYDGHNMAVLQMPGGTFLGFEVMRNVLDDGNVAIVGQLIQIMSSNGNMVDINLDPQMPTSMDEMARPRRILSIIDSFGRPIFFNYEDAQNRSLVTRIVDFAGRQVRYQYTCTGQLARVTTPSVTSTGGINDFPNGKTTEYTYYGEQARSQIASARNLPLNSPELDVPAEPFELSIASKTAPNQSGTGLTRLEWTYYVTITDGSTSPALLDDDVRKLNGRVKTHRIGNAGAPGDLGAGGLYQYSYEFFQPMVVGANSTVVRARVIDRRGTRTDLEYSRTGQLLREAVFSQSPSLRVGSATAFVSSYEYNADGELIVSVDPNGIRTEFLRSAGMESPRRSRRNITEERILPISGREADQSEIRRVFVYEPVFNRVFKEIDPRGFEPGNQPENFTTTYVFDYMEDLDSSIEFMASGTPLSESQLRSLFTDRGIASFGDVNGDGKTAQRFGRVVKVIHPPVDLPEEASMRGLGSSQQAVETFRYNEFGQKIQHVDAEGNVSEWIYNAARDPDGDGVVDNPAGHPSTGGYLRQVVHDLESANGRNSGLDPAPVQATTTYHYDVQGNFPANPRGVPTAIVDPRGIEHRFLINERDQIIKKVRAASVAESPEPDLDAFAYEEVTLYDANDNVIEKRIQNKDTLDEDNDFIVYRYSYDILDQMVEEIQDVGGIEIRNRYEYDASQNPTAMIRGAGSSEQSVTRMMYDERDLLIATTRGADAPEASTGTTQIDASGNVIGLVDADGGDIETIIRDGYDRVRTKVDRVGNRDLYFYDSASNIVRTQSFGPVDGSGGGSILLREAAIRYDTRNRRVRLDRGLFHYGGGSGGPLDGGSLASPGDPAVCVGGRECVSSVWIHDRVSRVVGVADADGELWSADFDGRSRVIAMLDPVGNRVEQSYDPSDNLLERRELEVSELLADAEEFITTWTYDSLDRVELTREPNGQVTRITYDSRDNPVRRIDALANTVEWRHDRLDRMIETRRYLASIDATVASPGASAAGASRFNLDSVQGGGDGVISTRVAYDDLYRVTARADDNGELPVGGNPGKATRYEYDDLDRAVIRRHPDGTSERWVYNADSELLLYEKQDGTSGQFTYDAASRPLTISIDNQASPGARGTTFQRWEYDGLDRVTFALDDNGPGESDAVNRYTYDSLSRILSDSQALAGSPTIAVESEWRAEAERTATIYPNGRRVGSSYDELNREVSVFDEAVPGLQSSGPIASFAYVGPIRDLQLELSNGTQLDKRAPGGAASIASGGGYDANRRHSVHRWTRTDSSLVAGFRVRYNSANALVSESREHLGRGDQFILDSAYRLVRFRHMVPLDANGSVPGTSSPDSAGELARSSVWTRDGAHNWGEYTRRNENLAPEVDLAGGVNEYSRFAGDELVYDANGNLIRDDRFRYFYDFFNRLSEVEDLSEGSRQASYAYDHLGRRVSRFSTSEIRRYLYRGWHVIEERDTLGTTGRQYVYREGRVDYPVQLRAGTGLPEPQDFYYHLDSRGNVGALTDSTGEVQYYPEYDAWGGSGAFGLLIDPSDPSQALSTDPLQNAYFWQARRRDSETGFDYLRHRYYQPEQGRFLQADPLGTWGDPLNVGNRYAFAASRPGWRDPFGLEGGFPYAGVDSDFAATMRSYDRAVARGAAKQITELPGSVVQGAKDLATLYTDSNATRDGILGAAESLSEELAEARAAILKDRVWEYLDDRLTEFAENPELVGRSLVTVGAVLATRSLCSGGIRTGGGSRRLPFKDQDRLTEVNKTLDRIESNGPFPHKKDGTVFTNREGRLPEGSYREYTVDTPGASNRGARRVVVDQDSGRVFYTDDHYRSFVQIDPSKQ